MVAAVGAAALFSLAYTRAGITAFFRLFDPLWQLVRPLLLGLVVLLGRLLDPLLLWFEAWLTDLLARGRNGGQELNPGAAGGAGAASPLQNLPRWPLDLARDALLLDDGRRGGAGLCVFLLLYLERVRKSGQRSEDEDEGLERATFGGGMLRRAADRCAARAR